MKWEISVSEDVASGKLAFRFWKPLPQGQTKVMCPIVKEGKISWSFVVCEELEELPITFEVPLSVARLGFLDSLATELKAIGARCKGESGQETLLAMGNHLSDLKSLIFGSDHVTIERRTASDADI